MGEKRNDGRVGLNRRTFVKSAVASSLAGSGMAAGAAAASESTFVIEQDGTEIPIAPLSYGGESIEEFYGFTDHGHNHSNTKTGLERKDSSQLFLWDGPKGLSLVAIHDSPHNGTSGEVTFEFSGLPDSGSWVVRDDDTGNDTYHGNSRVDWVWNGKNTDGGAYRGLDASTGVPFADDLRIVTGDGIETSLSNSWHYKERFDRSLEGFDGPVWVFVFADNADFDSQPSGDLPRPFSIENGEIVPESGSGTEPTNDIYFVLEPDADGSTLKLVGVEAGMDNEIRFGDETLIQNTNTASDGQTFSLPGVSDVNVTVTPDFQYGISEWQVLSGDASNPDRHALDMNRPVTIRSSGADDPGDSPSQSFQTARQEKLGLADRIDAISAGKTDDRARVEPTLSGLADAVSAGDLSNATATEAVQRMKLGESLTESLFVGAYDASPRFDGEFGVPSRSTVYGGGPVQFVTRTSNVVVSRVTDLFLMVALHSKLWRKIPGVGKLLDDASSFLKEGVESVVEYVGRASDLISADDYFLRHLLRNSQDIADAGIDILFEGGKTAASEYADTKQDRGGPLESLTADYVMDRGLKDDLARDGRDVATVAESLDDLDDSLSADAGFEFDASLSEGASAVNYRRGNIATAYYQADQLLTEKLEVLDAIDVVGKIIEIAGLLSSWFIGVGQVLALAGALMQAAGSVIDAVVAALDGITTVQDARYEHFLGMERLVE